jgi:hypothetical protein
LFVSFFSFFIFHSVFSLSLCVSLFQGGYDVLAGRDATLALGTMSLNKEDVEKVLLFLLDAFPFCFLIFGRVRVVGLSLGSF